MANFEYPEQVEAERTRLEHSLADAMKIHAAAGKNLDVATDRLLEFNAKHGREDT